jgi:hypothetical protein
LREFDLKVEEASIEVRRKKEDDRKSKEGEGEEEEEMGEVGS